MVRQWLAFIFMSIVLAACGPAEQAGDAAAGVTPAATAVSPAEPPPPTPTTIEDPYSQQRQAMVQNGIVANGISDPAVIDAMMQVPRHQFVPDAYLDQAYANHPLPIGFGQTISQPYIVALMTEAIQIEPGDKVLEIGTGSAYQAAVLAELVDQVHTIEIIGELAQRAEGILAKLGYDNVTVYHADGYFGLEEEGPFDAIVVTAAPDHIPQPLLAQLKIDGYMIIPVGPVGGVQTLWRVTRTSADEVQTENLGAVRFVPLTRESE